MNINDYKDRRDCVDARKFWAEVGKELANLKAGATLTVESRDHDMIFECTEVIENDEDFYADEHECIEQKHPNDPDQ